MKYLTALTRPQEMLAVPHANELIIKRIGTPKSAERNPIYSVLKCSRIK